MAAAIGSVQLERLEAMVRERRMLAAGYHERLAKLAAAQRLRWQDEPSGARHCYQTFSVLLAEGVDRGQLIDHMLGLGIECGPATYAAHRIDCLLYTSPSPRDATLSRMPSSA